MAWWREVSDWDADGEVLRRARYGVIEMAEGRLRRILLRPFPKLLSLPDIGWLRNPMHRLARGDRCLLYYNHPRRANRYLALKHIVSTSDCTFRTFRRALVVLDEIARRKGIDGIVCDVVNFRISSRLLARWGWSPMLGGRWHRPYIKRFYGIYPPVPPVLREILPPVVPDSPATDCRHPGPAAGAARTVLAKSFSRTT